MNPFGEREFEDHVTNWLIAHGGYQAVKWGNGPDHAADFDPARGLDLVELRAFIETTQPEQWARLVQIYGVVPGAALAAFADRLSQLIDRHGTVAVLREPIRDRGVTIRLAYFRPANVLNPDLVEGYRANRLTITRQLPYEQGSGKTVDLCLFVNGIPVATAELKNPLTGQTVEHAIAQYREDRDPRNVTLGRRVVVHFAVDTERVSMTTRLVGLTTAFLPFNRGHDYGAGNPPNPDGHRTAYLWERVWQRHAWLDLLARFVHVERQRGQPDRVIFPRYHQWHAVLSLERDARERGAGQRYLVMHSAGSGKSNTIAWLAHRLSSLHDDANVKVFDKVIVITDRIVLDKQLQDIIYQFEHVHGVVERIDERSQQLADALKSEQAQIIVTTLQKFPQIVGQVADLPQRRYAVIIDEAHSSQGGEAAHDLKVALGAPDQLSAAEAQEAATPRPDAEDLLDEQLAARGPQPNLSFFAFTATPKGRTLELFGELNPTTGKHEPFHLYSMRQAIEEGFILDVLANYLTYQTYWRVEKAVRDDPRYETQKARAAIARFVTLHPTNLAQRAQIIVEHFRVHTMRKIGGRAKAMIVTSSRLHAVRYKEALDAYIREHGYRDVRVLVAFSGRVLDGAGAYTEANMNHFPESQTTRRFDTDEYQVLVVADKYQTGFDQPLLHTMYVDKPLVGLAAVQTLSRLNRIHPDKIDTFVLDFRNDADEIRGAFEVYHCKTVAPPTDPNLLYDTRHALDPFGVLMATEVEGLTVLLLAPPGTTDHARLHAALAPAVDRYNALEDGRRSEFKASLDRFVRVYAFLSQVVTFTDADLERDCLYCRALRAFLRDEPGTRLDLGREVELTHLRHEVSFEGSLALPVTVGETRTVYSASGLRREPEEEPLSSIVQRLNERFGLNLTEADRLHLEGIAADMIANPQLQQRAAANSIENFEIEFRRGFIAAVVSRMRQSEELTGRLLDNQELSAAVAEAMLPRVYSMARVARQGISPIGELLSQGEDQHLELKSTLRWDLEAGVEAKGLETAVLKTVAGFLNSRYGGTLLIGVADDGSVVGLEHDFQLLHREGKDDRDLFQLHLTQLIRNAVGDAAATNVTTSIESVDGHDVCRAQVEPAGHPVYARLKEADSRGQMITRTRFYVRMNNQTRAIDDEEEVERYVAQRWPDSK
jgi:type I restriction enzyme R subunit